jgi:hypothetical protein
MIKRGGGVIAKAVPDVKQKTLKPLIVNHVEKDASVYTDE